MTVWLDSLDTPEILLGKRLERDRIIALLEDRCGCDYETGLCNAHRYIALIEGETE